MILATVCIHLNIGLTAAVVAWVEMMFKIGIQTSNSEWKLNCSERSTDRGQH